MAEPYTHADNVFGTTGGDDPSFMSLGQYISATVTAGNAVSVTTGTATNIVTMSLPPGDWDVSGFLNHSAGTSTSVTRIITSISVTSATTAGQAGGAGLGTDPTAIYSQASSIPTNNMVLEAGPVRMNTNANTTMFLVAQDTFTASTMQVYGTLRARRMR